MSTSRAQLVATMSLGISLLTGTMLWGIWWSSSSLIALSQAIDSVTDVLTAAVMIWAARLASQPADDEHPLGHQAAEPIAALAVAIVAGSMAVQLLRSAIEALLFGHAPLLDDLLLGTLALKMLLKVGVYIAATRSGQSPVLDALAIDARNDIAIGLTSMAGFFAASHGWPTVDAWVALPAGIWVAWGGFELARDNIDMLMGASAEEDRMAELEARIRSVPGVLEHHQLVARHHGTLLDVHVHVTLDERLTLRDAHDIGEAVEHALESEPDVARATVHLDVEAELPSE